MARSFAAAARAVCDDVGVVDDVRGSGATLQRNSQVYRVAPGNTICAGDKLSSGPSAKISFTAHGREGLVPPNDVKSFPRTEAQADSALDADDADEAAPPHRN
jgi:hypothetical protein